MEFTDRQIAYLLASLRYCQDIDIGWMDHFEDGLEPLNTEEINELCIAINCPPPPERCYTVVGLYPDSMWDGEMRDATFVEHVEAGSPTEAARAARLQMAKNLAESRGESPDKTEDELAESASEIAVLAVFEDHILDLYDPRSEQA